MTIETIVIYLIIVADAAIFLSILAALCLAVGLFDRWLR